MTAAITKIGARTLIVAGVFALVVAANHLRGIEPGTTFATQGIDLKVDSKTWYNGSLVPSSTWALKDLTPGVDKFWQFDDVKPGDFGCTVISLHVKKTDAYMCLDFKNLSESENGENEPESHEDTTSGPDLADGTQFFGWDDIDGDGKYEPPTEKILWGATPASQSLDDTTYVIGDSRGGGICQVDKTRYVGICWCAGALTPQSGMNKSSGSAVCDPTTLGNEAQTDSFTVDVALRAAPVKQNPRFLCDPDEPPPPPDTPSDKECKAYGYDRAVAKYEWEGVGSRDRSAVPASRLRVLRHRHAAIRILDGDTRDRRRHREIRRAWRRLDREVPWRRDGHHQGVGACEERACESA